MQEIFEKIINKLEEQKEYYKDIRNNTYCGVTEISECDSCRANYSLDARLRCVDDAIEIVKQEAKQDNNGWIPCSVSMPEERDSMFAQFKGTSKWHDGMFEKTSEEVNVTVSTEKGTKVTTHAHTTDGKWKCDLLRFNTGYRIIAWQPLPQPYQPKGDNNENTN